MKNLLIYFCFFALVITTKAQNVGACSSAQNICSNPNFTFTANNGPNGLPGPLSVSNPGTNPQGINSGCLLTNGPGPQWLIMTVSTTGTLGFSFGANGSPNPQAGFYDWAMWPYTSTTCNGIFNNTLPPVSCNWNASTTGGTGMGTIPPGGVAGNYQPALNVVAGQQFLLLISNYSSANALVSFTSTGSANITCGFNTAICAGQTTTVSPVGFIPMTGVGYTLQPGGASNITGSFSVSPTSNTTYTIFGSGINGLGQPIVQTSTTSVQVNPTPLVAPTTTQQTCLNSFNQASLNLTFNPSNATPNYTVNWSPQPLSVTNGTQTSATNINPGVTNVTVVAAGGCSTTSSFTMLSVVNPSVVVTNVTGQPSLTCLNSSVCLNAVATPSNATFFWINSSNTFTSSSPNICVSTTGTYNLLVTIPSSSCTTSFSTVISQNTLSPIVSVSPLSATLSCSATPPTFTATVTSPTVNTSICWSNPSINNGVPQCNTGSVTIFSPPVGTTALVYTNLLNGCISTRTVVVTTTTAIPVFTLTGTFTLGCAPSNTAQVCMVGATTGTSAVQYYINSSPTATVPYPANLFAGNLSCLNTSIPGQYTMAVIDNVSGCQSYAPISILANTFAPNSSVSILTQTLTCNNPTVLAIGSSTTPNTTFQWAYPQSGPNTLPSASITVGPVNGPPTSTSSLTYGNYTLTVTDGNNFCKNVTIVPINQDFRPPIISPATTNTSIISCKNPTVQITIVNAVFAGSTQNIPITQSTLTGSSYSTTGTSFIVSDVDTYTIQSTALSNGCISNPTFVIVRPDFNKPVIAPSNTFVLDCASANSSSAGIQVALQQTLSAWSMLFKSYPQGTSFAPAAFGVSPNGGICTNNSVSPIITVDKAGKYEFLVTNNTNGCINFATLQVNPGVLNADFAPSTQSGFAPLSVTFNNLSASSATSGASSNISSVWNFGNGTSVITSTSSVQQSATYNNPGTYTVLLVASKGECVDSSYKIINVELPSKLDIPNVFTPNGDKSNDIFFLKTSNLTEINALIFDRWGNKVYELVSSTGNIAWDGKNQAGIDCANGTYFYIIKAKGKDGVEYEQKGNVGLYR